jgi:hypothetical protein
MAIKHLAGALVTLAALGVIAPIAASAHFKLLAPVSWIVESERGDPQKAGPCGENAAGSATPSNIVGKAVGGQKLHLKLQETIFHPGHYRVALAVNSRAELPPDPEVTTKETDKGPWSVSAVIQNPPRVPVLADGVFVHTTRSTEPFETDVQLPNINCQKCTLQIVEFMAEHGYNNPGGYSYHHCADVQITADPAKPLDGGWPAARQN